MTAFWQPLVHGDLVQGAIDDSLWFRVVVGVCTIALLMATGFIIKNMVTKADILLLLSDMKDRIEERADRRFLPKEDGHRRITDLERATWPERRHSAGD